MMAVEEGYIDLDERIAYLESVVACLEKETQKGSNCEPY